MIEILALATIIAPVTAGVVEAIKRAAIIPKKYLPLISTAIGIAIGISAYFFEAEIGIRIWAGGISGLAATGLFELGKKSMEAK